MRTLIEWLQLWTDETCPDCREAIERLEELQKTDNSDGFEGFVLTIHKTAQVPTIHIGRHDLEG
jgi:hypothetical protein